MCFAIFPVCVKSDTSLGCALSWTSHNSSLQWSMEWSLDCAWLSLSCLWCAGQNVHWSSQIYALLVHVFINHWSYFPLFSGSKVVLQGKKHNKCFKPQTQQFAPGKESPTTFAVNSFSPPEKLSAVFFRTASSRSLFWAKAFLHPSPYLFQPQYFPRKSKPASLALSLNISPSCWRTDTGTRTQMFWSKTCNSCFSCTTRESLELFTTTWEGHNSHQEPSFLTFIPNSSLL